MRYLLTISILLMSFIGFAQNYFLFIGTYTGKGSKGIYVYRFNTATGKAEWISNTDTASNPSYLAIASNGKFLYAVNETANHGPDGVSAYAFDKANGTLSLMNQEPSGGENPCYITINKKGNWVAVGNYSSGNLSVLLVNKDGSIGKLAQTIQHSGSGVNKNRQEKAHVHATVFSPDERYLFSPDLGIDKVMAYRFDAAVAQPLKPAQPPFAETEPGNGPRHFTFHPSNKYAYLIEEMSGTVTAFKYNDGKLSFLQRVNTHPADFKGAKGSADIHISPDGKFLYATNRGDANTITTFVIDAAGKLTWKDYQSTKGVHPRNFMIDPTGNYLLVANRDTNNIVIFKRDKKTGLIQPTGDEIKIPSPVCLKMMKQ